MFFTIYRDTKDEWRWSLKSNSGKIIADSAESYHNKQDCIHGINLVKQANFATPVAED